MSFTSVYDLLPTYFSFSNRNLTKHTTEDIRVLGHDIDCVFYTRYLEKLNYLFRGTKIPVNILVVFCV